MAEEIILGFLGTLNLILVGLVVRLTSKVSTLEARLKFISDQLEYTTTFKRRQKKV